jgi:hypothetical protein
MSRGLHQNLQLQRYKFEKDKVPKCLSATIQGKVRTGKTNLAATIARKLFKNIGIQRFVVFGGNALCRADWAKTVPPLYIHGPSIEQLAKILDTQEKLITEDRKRFERKYPDQDYSVPISLCIAIFFDDLGSNKDFMNDKLMKRLATEGRQWGIYRIWILQNFNQLCTEIRDNQDFFITTQCKNEKVMQKIYEEYVGSKIIPKKGFNTIVGAATSSVGMALLIDNAVTTNDITNILYYIKFPVIEKKDGLIGHPAYIEHSNRHYMSKLDIKEVEKHKEAVKELQSTYNQKTSSASSSTHYYHSSKHHHDTKKHRSKAMYMTWEEQNIPDEARLKRKAVEQRHGEFTGEDHRGNTFTVKLA